MQLLAAAARCVPPGVTVCDSSAQANRVVMSSVADTNFKIYGKDQQCAGNDDRDVLS